MRNFWTIILCISISGPFASGYLFVHLFHFLHRQNIQYLLGANRLDDELITLHFSKMEFASLAWEHENEFAWSGKMYDVKQVSVTPDGFDVVCRADEKESRLLGKDRSTPAGQMTDRPLPVQKRTQIPTNKIQLDLPGNGIPFVLQEVGLPSLPVYPETILAFISSEPPTPPPDLEV